jgi:hypothetical protein
MYLFTFILSPCLYECVVQDKHVIEPALYSKVTKSREAVLLKNIVTKFSGDAEQDLIPFGLVMAFFLKTA